jgi:hypothetical protein
MKTAQGNIETKLSLVDSETGLKRNLDSLTSHLEVVYALKPEEYVPN